MHPNHITDDFAVSGQPSIKDVSLASAMGFHTIICNRPDGEEYGQALFEQIAAECKLSGLKAIYMPVAPSGHSEQDVIDFLKAFGDARKPVLAYCSTGARSNVLFEAAPV